ncbi:MAG: 4-hydroxy-tetrahydrodipicolinate synthase [Candidatus Saliniplasma sp.]
MEKMINRFEGIYPAAITPFDEYENLDESKLIDFLDFLIDGGVHGIYLLGTNGEAPLLDMDEKKRVIELAVEHIDGEIPVVAGTMCNSTKKTIELSRYAEKKGADAVHIIIPYYFPSTRTSLVKHFKDISKEISLPVFIYSIPQRTGNDLELGTLKELSKVDNVVAVKDSSGDLDFFYSCIEEFEDLHFFGGNDSLIFSYLTLGGSGAVTAAGNVYPELVSSIYDHFVNGDFKKAKEAQDKVLRISNVMKKGPYLSGVKAALKVRGLDFGEVRRPLVPFSSEEMELLKEELKVLELL